MKYRSLVRPSAGLGLVLGLLAAASVVPACGDEGARAFEDGGVDASRPVFEAGPGIEGDAGRPQFDPDAGCESASFAAEPVPLTLVVLLDRSGSMQMSGTDHWTPATNAIRAFVDRSEVIGMEVGLSFFPSKTGSGSTTGDYAKLAVPIDTLPENVLPVMNELGRTTPNGGTPMGAALEGTVQALRTYIATSGPRAAGIVLVTDGDPTDGKDRVIAAAQSAANPAAGTAKVTTFAVGMQGASFGTLNQIAIAGGGSDAAFDVGQGAGMQQALLGALDTIRTGAIGCEYVLPVPDRGKLSPESVEVRFTPGENDPSSTFRLVANVAGCGATTGGFYYDNPTEPTQITLCPASCDAVNAGASSAKVDVFLGCILPVN